MYNASDTIIETLDSCIDQTYLPKEIIVVDDCSQDDSVSIISEYLKRYEGSIEIRLEVLKKNSGPSKARNLGWELANGVYVAFLDAGDIFVENKLQVVNGMLKSQNDIVLLGHSYSVDSQEKDEIGIIKQLKTMDLLKRNYFATSTVVVKKNIPERFDDTMRYIEDQDLFLRVTQKYDQTYVLDRSLVVREREMNTKGGLSENLWAMRKGEIKMYHKFCKSNHIIVLFPLLYIYSISKHGYKIIKDVSRK